MSIKLSKNTFLIRFSLFNLSKHLITRLSNLKIWMKCCLFFFSHLLRFSLKKTKKKNQFVIY